MTEEEKKEGLKLALMRRRGEIMDLGTLTPRQRQLLRMMSRSIKGETARAAEKTIPRENILVSTPTHHKMN